MAHLAAIETTIHTTTPVSPSTGYQRNRLNEGVKHVTDSGARKRLGKVVHATHGYVMRKATKTAKKVSPNSEELKESYDIFATAVENSIPADLIVNWDQTGVNTNNNNKNKNNKTKYE